MRAARLYLKLLFNLYINDLPFAFENTLSDPFVLPDGAKINSLLYADDLIILSRSKTGLENCPFCGCSVIEDKVHFLFKNLHTL